MQKCQTMQGELENTCKPDIHCALVAQWTCTKVMKEQWEINECFHTFCKNFENFILCISEHLFSFALKLLSVDVFRCCSIKKSRTFKNQNQFQILSRPLNRTPEIQGLSRCILTLKWTYYSKLDVITQFVEIYSFFICKCHCNERRIVYRHSLAFFDREISLVKLTVQNIYL